MLSAVRRVAGSWKVRSKEKGRCDNELKAEG